ncbi:hypothetical protein HGRIS_013718 [Hohenbuehelia grisea]|uniref:Uncharacterized protein n=1 Tax=Hohenbuehelia grisea TaxID=104357 RepID=A0ABR3IW86_9AGAR
MRGRSDGLKEIKPEFVGKQRSWICSGRGPLRLTYTPLLQTPMSPSSTSSTSSSSLSSRLSTSSSLSSTFSDVSYSSLAAVPSPSVSPPPPHKPSKTHSFFASTFTPPAPPSSKMNGQDERSDLAQPAPKRSLTASFFATPPPQDVPISIIPPTDLSSSKPRILLSRLFPSRYSSDPYDPPTEDDSTNHDHEDTPQPFTNHSATASFFATPSHPDIPISIIPPASEPATSSGSKSKSSRIPLSRLFPSRYSSDPSELSWTSSDDTRHTHDPDRHQRHSNHRSRRQFLVLETEHPDPLHPQVLVASPTSSSSPSLSPVTPSSPLARQLSGLGSEEEDDEPKERMNGKSGRGHHLQAPVDSETETERTPRPVSQEPPAYLQRHGQPRLPSQLRLHPANDAPRDAEHGARGPKHYPVDPASNDQDDDLEGGLSSGSVICSPALDSLPSPPSHYHSIQEPQQTVLRLLSPLGNGAFSAVWLARDESDLSLTQRARLRIGLERKSSLRRNGSLKNRGTLVLSRQSSMKRKGSKRHRKHPSTGTDGESSLRRSDSGRSTRSLISVPSIASLKSAASNDSDTSTASSATSGNTTMLVALGKGGVCGVRPWASVSNTSNTVEHDTEEVGVKSVVGLGLRSPSGSLRGAPKEDATHQRLVAVKMTSLPARNSKGDVSVARQEDQERERMRVSFVREVEVLKVSCDPCICFISFSSPGRHDCGCRDGVNCPPPCFLSFCLFLIRGLVLPQCPSSAIVIVIDCMTFSVAYPL